MSKSKKSLRTYGHILGAGSGLPQPIIILVLLLSLPLLSGCGGGTGEKPADPLNRSAVSEPTSENLLPAAPGTGSTSALLSSGQTNILATFNPCEMLTPSEVETFLGEPMAPDAAPESIGPYRSCSFTNQARDKLIMLQLTHETAAQFKSDNEGSAAILEMIPTPVPGLGDEAVFISGLLRVRVGELVLQVLTWHPEEQQDLSFSVTQDIARIALARMP